jgi:hypothetical protein
MNNTPSSVDRREVRTSLIAILAVFFTLLMGSLDYVLALDRPFAGQFAWAGASEPAAEQGAPTISTPASVPASTDALGADVTDVDSGCGSAESCLVQAP